MAPGPVADVPMILAAPAERVTATTAPNGLDLVSIAADLRTDHVYTDTPDQLPALEKVVAHARADGHDIYLVVLAQQQPKFTMYRDIATELQQHVGGTVLVFGPNSVGSASPEFSRVKLEEATDNLTLKDPPTAARQMVDSITAPGVDWTLVSIVLIVVVVIGAVIGRLTSLRRRARVAPTNSQPTDPVEASSTVVADDSTGAVGAATDRDSGASPDQK